MRKGPPRRHRVSYAARSSGSRGPVFALVVVIGIGALGLVLFLTSGTGGPSFPPPEAPERAAPTPAPRPPEPEKPQTEPYPEELIVLDREVRGSMKDGDYGRAMAALQLARTRYPLAAWMAAVDRRLDRTRGEIDKTYAALEAEALDARRRGAEDQVRAAVRRAAAWNLKVYSEKLDKALAAVPAREVPWRAVFDGSSTSFLKESRGWRVDGGALVRDPGPSAPAVSGESFGDGEVRFRFRVLSPGSVSFEVRHTADGRAGVYLDADAVKALGGAEHVLVFTMEGDAITAAMDGEAARVSRLGHCRPGALRIDAQGAGLSVRSVEYRTR